MPKLFNLATNKQGLFVYGGVASSDYGIVVSEAPTFEKPTRKQSVFSVPGRNGSVIFPQYAWNDVTRKYKVFLTKDANQHLVQNVDALTAWLNTQNDDTYAALYRFGGYCRLEDSFEPEVFRLAYYSGGDDVTNEMTQYGEAVLKFTCRPERFFKEGETAHTLTISGQSVGNPTRFISKPLIHVEASNATVSLTIGGKTCTLGVTDSIDVDCDLMQCYKNLPTVNMNQYFSGEFPQLLPGNNIVTFTNATKVVIIPRYYTI